VTPCTPPTLSPAEAVLWNLRHEATGEEGEESEESTADSGLMLDYVHYKFSSSSSSSSSSSYDHHHHYHDHVLHTV